MMEEKKMADLARDDDPLSEMQFPEKSEPLPGFVPSRGNRAGPVPLERASSARLLPESVVEQPLGEWPAERESRREPLRSTAENLGLRIAQMRSQARDLSERVQDRVENLASRLRVAGGRAAEDVSDRAEELRDTTVRQARIARTRAQRIAYERPLEFIGMAAAAGLVIGFMLRIFQED